MRLILQDALATRCAGNPHYSLRSFARFLAISPAALSALINGKRPITDKMKERLGLKLGLSLEQLAKIKAKPHGNSKLKPHRQAAGKPFHQVTIDIFNIISEPYHYALMELIKTHDFQSNSRWIASRLGITASEVNIAVERLERTGLLYRDEKGQLLDVTGGFSTDIRAGLSSLAQRRFQIRSLQAAMNAVESIPPFDRDNTSMTMAVHANDLPKARHMIKEFRRSFCARMESNPNLDEVYQLTISFIPITKIKGS